LNIRWDVLLGNIDKKSLVELVAVPTIKDKLHRLILCGKRYIEVCGNKLKGGNMIVKRRLMCGNQKCGYDDDDF
jgi:hypothetical protein